MSADRTTGTPNAGEDRTVMQKRVDRRRALGILFGGVAVGAQAMSACSPLGAMTGSAPIMRTCSG